MARNEGEALARILDAAEVQLDLLADAATRPEVDSRGLAATGLELLLEAMAATVAEVPGDRYRAFAARVAEVGAASEDVRLHLIELAEGWACKSCGADVAKDASIAGIKARKPKLSLVCKACGRATPVAALGLAAFKTRFGRRVSPAWNPSLQGFIWDGT